MEDEEHQVTVVCLFFSPCLPPPHWEGMEEKGQRTKEEPIFFFGNSDESAADSQVPTTQMNMLSFATPKTILIPKAFIFGFRID